MEEGAKKEQYPFQDLESGDIKVAHSIFLRAKKDISISGAPKVPQQNGYIGAHCTWEKENAVEFAHFLPHFVFDQRFPQKPSRLLTAECEYDEAPFPFSKPLLLSHTETTTAPTQKKKREPKNAHSNTPRESKPPTQKKTKKQHRLQHLFSPPLE